MHMLGSFGTTGGAAAGYRTHGKRRSMQALA